MKLQLNLTNQNTLLSLSVIIFLITIIFTNFGYLKNREYPHGFDNQFGFLIKSKNFEHCFFEKCKGLLSIEKQFENLNNDNDDKLKNQFERLKSQVFKIYHPLYSILVLAINSIFDDLLKSRVILNFIFIFLIVYSVVLVSNQFFNKYTTSLILVFFSLNNYGGWGFGHQINPFILSQSFSMLIYYYLIKDSKIKVILINILATLMHPIGIFTNIISIIFALFINFKKKLNTNLFLIVINLILILFTFYNDLSFFEKISVRNTEIFLNNESYYEILKGNIKTIILTYQTVFNLYTIPVILLASIFYISLKNDKKISLIVCLTYLMVVVTMLLDKSGVRLSQRFMNLSSLIMIGSFLYILINYLKFLKNYLEKKLNKKYNFNKKYKLYFVPILILCFLINVKIGIKNYKEYYSYFHNNFDISFSKTQTELVEDNSIIIFDKFERADYFFMLNGLHKNNSFYYKIKNSLFFDTNLLKSDDTKYFVSMTPFYHDDVDEYFSKGDKIIILNNENEETFFKLNSSKKGKIFINDKIFHINEKNLKSFNNEFSIKNKRVKIEVLHGKVKFVKLGKQKISNYPWERKISVLIEGKNFSKKIDFKKLNFFDCETNMINDDGSSVLYKIKDCKI